MTLEKKDSYIINPLKKDKKKSIKREAYNSYNNKDFLSVKKIKKLILENKKDFDSI